MKSTDIIIVSPNWKAVLLTTKAKATGPLLQQQQHNTFSFLVSTGNWYDGWSVEGGLTNSSFIVSVMLG